ncbi:MAG: DUF2442 domain-containing protein [Planctomycetia bacterium]|nr:DUF2442 domain-containing protein [Planctomycetia bacterium]
MNFLPSVVRAQYRGGHSIWLVFNDGSEGLVSFRRWLKGPVFESLKDLDFFRRFFVDGGTVAWPNGADIAPETLYAAVARKPSGSKVLRRAKGPRAAAKKSLPR